MLSYTVLLRFNNLVQDVTRIKILLKKLTHVHPVTEASAKQKLQDFNRRTRCQDNNTIDINYYICILYSNCKTVHSVVLIR